MENISPFMGLVGILTPQNTILSFIILMLLVLRKHLFVLMILLLRREINEMNIKGIGSFNSSGNDEKTDQNKGEKKRKKIKGLVEKNISSFIGMVGILISQNTILSFIILVLLILRKHLFVLMILLLRREIKEMNLESIGSFNSSGNDDKVEKMQDVKKQNIKSYVEKLALFFCALF